MHDPTYVGLVKDIRDAAILIQAADIGILKRLLSKLSTAERNEIKSGYVYVYTQAESGISRWRDGKTWSPSRIWGNYLIYKEVEEKHQAKSEAAQKQSVVSATLTHGEHDLPEGPLAGGKGVYYFKKGGLVKKTISLTLGGVDHHIVAYSSSADQDDVTLQRPSERPGLQELTLPDELEGAVRIATLQQDDPVKRRRSEPNSMKSSPEKLIPQTPFQQPGLKLPSIKELFGNILENQKK